MTEMVGDFIKDYWPMILFLLGIIWNQIHTHFDVRELKEKCNELKKDVEDNMEDIHGVKVELHEAIKEQGRMINENIKSLTEVTGRLAISTEVMATELKHLKEKK